MPHIRGTPFIVDDFRFATRHRLYKNFIYFLSHFHADHYRGLSCSFDHGPIYCVRETAELVFARFPALRERVVVVELNQPCTVSLGESFEAKVTFMDANHIIGSAMILFEGEFGNVLYSGDLRWHDKLIEMNTPLFNPNGSLKLPIDELILDNTYCDPIFAFPSQENCVEIIKEIVEKNREEFGDALRVKMYCYTIGKEEICLDLARKFKTKVVLDADRFRMITKLNYHPGFFTRDPKEGFIHMSKGVNAGEKEQEDATIHINLTGWINCSSYLSLKKNEYLVAYSSHSNFKELDRFVSLIRPAVLNNIVIEKELEASSQHVKHLGNYFFSLKSMKQRGFAMLREKYSDLSRATERYNRLFDPVKLNELYARLGIDKSMAEVNGKIFFEDNKQFMESRELNKNVAKGVKYTQAKRLPQEEPGRGPEDQKKPDLFSSFDAEKKASSTAEAVEDANDASRKEKTTQASEREGWAEGPSFSSQKKRLKREVDDFFTTKSRKRVNF